MNYTEIQSILGKEAEHLLKHQCQTVGKETAPFTGSRLGRPNLWAERSKTSGIAQSAKPVR